MTYEKKNHVLAPIKNSRFVFKCEKCDNIICESFYHDDWYFLNYIDGRFYPLKDCNEMIIAEVLG